MAPVRFSSSTVAIKMPIIAALIVIDQGDSCTALCLSLGLKANPMATVKG